MCEFVFNRMCQTRPGFDSVEFAAFRNTDIQDLHRSLKGYTPTPLLSLPSLAAELGVKEVRVKDESHRLGLNAFKVLGASYAIYRFIKQEWERRFGEPFEIDNLFDGQAGQALGEITFCTATDGNHGRAVAWMAARVSQPAVIYVPENTVQSRVESITKEGARVIVVEGTYDDTVNRVARDAKENGWQIISDTAYPGYLEIPAWVMAGYTTMFREIETALASVKEPGIDIVFIQSGVGSFAAAATWYYVTRYGKNRPKLINVEPCDADCLMESALSTDGEIRSTQGKQNSIMAGLNCGTPSVLAWPIIREGMDMFMSVSDRYCEKAMCRYYYPSGDDPGIISGESGAAGLAGLLALCQEESFAGAREKLGLNANSRILLINTEGATDPVSFRKIVGQKA